MAAPFDLAPFREAAAQSFCLPVGHPVWGIPGSAGAFRNREDCLLRARRTVADPLAAFTRLCTGELVADQSPAAVERCVAELFQRDFLAGGGLGLLGALDPMLSAPFQTLAIPPLGAAIDPVTGTGLPIGIPGGPSNQLALAQALIASGDLVLGPEAFQTPAAQAALAAALAGGNAMSALTFTGLGGQPPGLSTPIVPFGSFLSAGGVLPSPTMPDAAGGSGGTLLNIFGGLLNTGAQFFAAQQQAKLQEDLIKQQIALVQAQAMASPMMGFAPTTAVGGLLGGITGILNSPAGAGMLGGLAGGAAQALLLGGAPPFASGGCGSRQGVTVDMSSAAGIYRMACSGPVTRNRFFAQRADGTKDLFVKVGKVQSVSPRQLTRFARRWAKQARLTLGGGRRRAGRRRPR